MINSLLDSARDRITASEMLLRATLPIVNAYRKGLTAYGPSTTTVTINGFSCEFYTETFEEIRHFYPIYGERDELADLLSELQPTDTFYDIGAHVGIYTCFASQIIDEGQVVAFEPVQPNVDRLGENLRMNNASADIHSVALSDESNWIEIDIDSNLPGTIGHLTKDAAEKSDSVNMVIGDDYIQENNIPIPDVIKIDIEGAECKALRGLEDSLDDCRLIYCEVSNALQKYGDTEEELVGFLREKGFEIEYFSERGVTHGDLKATRNHTR